MSDLKPCPFCGSDDLSVHLDDGFSYYVWCGKCGSQTDNDHLTEKEAIKAWNTRPTEDALTAEMERLKAVIAEQNYVLGRFGEWWHEGGCPKIQYPEFPCQEENDFNEDPEQEGYKFTPYDCDMECDRGCWVQYYRWLYRENNGFGGKYAPETGKMEE